MVNPPQESRSELLLKVLSLISWMGTLEKDWENHSTLKKCRDCTGMWEGDGFTLFYNVNADFSGTVEMWGSCMVERSINICFRVLLSHFTLCLFVVNTEEMEKWHLDIESVSF